MDEWLATNDIAAQITDYLADAAPFIPEPIKDVALVQIGHKTMPERGNPPEPGMVWTGVDGGRWVHVARRPKPVQTPHTAQARKATEANIAQREADRRARGRAEYEEREKRTAHELERAQIAWDLAVATGHFVPDDPIENERIRRDFTAHPEKYPRPS